MQLCVIWRNPGRHVILWLRSKTQFRFVPFVVSDPFVLLQQVSYRFFLNWIVTCRVSNLHLALHEFPLYPSLTMTPCT